MRWMNIHPVSCLISFLMVFHAILRQISNFCFCATSSRELAVCAIFYAFYNYDSKPPVMFQTIDAVIKRSNFRLKKLGEILKNVLIQIDILNWNQVNQQNTFNWTIWCVFTSFPNFFLSYKSLPSCRWHADLEIILSEIDQNKYRQKFASEIL